MVASCWLFLYDLYYDARNHERQVDPIPAYSPEIKPRDTLYAPKHGNHLIV
jgi:hypothetical protein